MKLEFKDALKFDFSNLSLKQQDFDLIKDKIKNAWKNIKEIRQGKILAHGEPALFMGLPYQDKEKINKINSWAKDVKENYDTVVSLGIGGSYLGNKTLQDALAHPYYNECKEARAGWPKIYFAGDNLDPYRLNALLDIIDIKSTKFIIISKSGGTVEPMSSFAVILDRIKKANGNIKKQITAITDESKGLLREMVNKYGWDSFIVPDGIGGRWTVLSEVGLVTAAAAGINIEELLLGAKKMDELCQNENVFKNPAFLYAASVYILYKNKNKNITVIMPYSNSLKSVGDWYVQLLAESLGKKIDKNNKVVNEGRTPIPALGTTDMHAQTQQHIEGANIRSLTFIGIEDFKENDIIIPEVFNDYKGIAFIGKMKMSKILSAAMLSNEMSLAEAGRPNCNIKLPELNAFYLGQLLYFFEMATAFEGELLNVNSYDQPGVEAYKKIMKKILL